MTWSTILERLKSPVVIVQLIAIAAASVVTAWPTIAPEVKIVVDALTAAYNVFAGLNNPADRESF